MTTSRETWAARIAAWRQSGRTQSAFCREHGWNASTFQYWLRASKRPSSPSAVMVPVVLEESTQAASNRIEVRRGPWAVSFPASVDSAWLGAVLRNLCAC